MKTLRLLLLAGLLGVATPAFADDGGTSGSFVLELPQSQIDVTRGDRPPMDPVGGVQLGIIGGVQLRGSASGTVGLALGYYKRSTASFGVELEVAATRGPTGEVYHGMVNFIVQSGARSARLIPYIAVGAGMFHARERVQDNLASTLASIGILIPEETETGPIVGFGLGVRYHLTPGVSFRVDYREFRGLTGSDSGFWDRLYALRRIAGFFAFHF